MKLYKDFQSKIEDVDEKGRVLVAANAIGNVDSDEDRSMPGSFTKTLKENFNRLKWFLNHRTDQLLGVPVEGKEDGTFLKMLGQLNMKKELSRDTYEDYKLYAEYDRSLEHSIGVEPIKKEDKDGVRNVFEWRLWEYSTLTAWGANEFTPMLGIKSEKDIAELIEWFSVRLKKGNYTDEKFLQIENQLLQLKSLLIEPDKTTHDEPMKSEPEISTRIIRKESDFILTTFLN
jgi:HK97 family phage prohead protease